MRPLRVTAAGEKAQQVELRGDPRNPEPDHFRVVFPGGDVDLARCDDGSYWIHVRVDRPGDSSDDGEGIHGVVLAGRVDVHGRHTSEIDAGLLADPGLYHLAIRVGRQGEVRERVGAGAAAAPVPYYLKQISGPRCVVGSGCKEQDNDCEQQTTCDDRLVVKHPFLDGRQHLALPWVTP